jgi:hypothetical protein
MELPQAFSFLSFQTRATAFRGAAKAAIRAATMTAASFVAPFVSLCWSTKSLVRWRIAG